ncbi:peptide deformylase [Thermobifida fusca]|jgi:peptide deformylase|uniref:Peptide deformylase n=2 Tax=Thermobifida fusca TaxID=2021 RepID=A0A9P2WQE5_THEFU|nr:MULTISPECIES: peptide deformylase [Thermobifida]AAZ56466.1 peptide deformylase [Thermobifida fusca YX]EOR70458.1 peptide deformylase [Thermobifida fusca TM51]MBO2530424.1 peptide deformylase [Thermobifida sp.]MDD6790602.1 peptide deformylase [Thermobifida fusca]PPS91881.1 peptide deformylase [Thermobifida fusca]
MTKRPIVLFGDPVLSTPAAPITTFNRHTEALIRDLMDTVDAPGRAGVAAPQIGVGLRAFSYRVDGQIGYVINPEIVELSEEIQEDGNEGCLSVPGLWYPTPRARRAVVKGVDLRNEPVVVAGTGVMARCLQHETDHLAGKLYLDRLPPETRRAAMREIRRSPWFLGARETPPSTPSLPSAFGGKF